MRCWILKTNLETYKHLCDDEGIVPVILEETEDKAHVDMTVHTASVWNMFGYWYQIG
jgi:hypothetical protein